MPASYPGAIKSFTTKVDGVDDVLAAHINDPQLEITAIETELGTDPAGTYTNVKTRLDEMQEPVAARYATNAGQNIPNNTATRVDFEDISYDTHSAVTTGASWVFTAPSAGYYNVSFQLVLAASTGWAASEAIEVLSDGTAGTLAVYYSEMNPSGGASTRVTATGSFDCVLAAGGTLWLTLRQVSGGDIVLLNNANYNWICIHKILGG